MIGFACLWLFVFAVPWENIVKIEGIGTIGSLLGMVAAGGVLLTVAVNGRVRPLRAFHLFVLGFTAWAVVGMFWVPLPQFEEAMSKISTYLQLTLLIWVVWELTTTYSRVFHLLTAYLFGCYVSALQTIRNYQTGVGTRKAETRFAAEGFDPNDLGMVLAVGLPMAWYLSIVTKSVVLRWVARGYIPVGVLAILLTGSRSALIAAAVGLVMVPLTLGQVRVGVKVAAIVALFVAAYVAVTVVPTTTWARLGTVQSEIASGTMNTRTMIWKAGVQAFPEHPITGHGPAMFRWAIRPITGYTMRAHNTFLGVLVEHGLIGFTLFLGILVSVIRGALRMPVLERRYMLVQIAVIGVAFLPLTWEGQKAWWVTLAALVCGIASIRQSQEASAGAASAEGRSAVPAFRFPRRPRPRGAGAEAR